MKKQIRFLIADTGDALAGTVSDALKRAGAWVVLRQQTRQALMYAVRTEHPDFIILNIMYPTMDFPTFADELLAQTDIRIIALFRGSNLFLERLLRMKCVYCWRLPATYDLVVHAICKKFLEVELPPETAAAEHPPKSDISIDIVNLLHAVGVPPRTVGFSYLRYAVALAARTDEGANQTKHLYLDIAAAFQANYGQVEHAIRHALKIAWENSHADSNPAHSFSWNALPTCRGRRPSNLEFISAAGSMIRHAVIARGEDPAETIQLPKPTVE